MTEAHDVITTIAKFNSILISNDFFDYETSVLNSNVPHADNNGTAVSARTVDRPLLSDTFTTQEASGSLDDDRELGTSEAMVTGEQTRGNGQVGSVGYTVDQPDKTVDLDIQLVEESHRSSDPVHTDRGSQGAKLKSVLALCASPRIRLYTFVIFFLL